MRRGDKMDEERGNRGKEKGKRDGRRKGGMRKCKEDEEK